MKKQILNELYNPKLASFQDGSFTISENDENAFVKSVSFNLPGAKFLVLGESLWNTTENIYTEKSEHFQFRRKCDGVVICSYQEQKYIIWIELKSSFNEIFEDAIFQLSGCYVKMKSYLKNFETFNSTEYKELGIVISQQDKKTVNDLVQNRRTDNTNTAIQKCRSHYRLNNQILLRGEDFGIEKLHLAPFIKLNELPVYFQPVTQRHTQNIDLASILQTI